AGSSWPGLYGISSVHLATLGRLPPNPGTFASPRRDGLRPARRRSTPGSPRPLAPPPPRGKAPSRQRYPPRLTEPLVRENGVLRPASWDEALDRAAGGVRAGGEKHGRTTFGVFSCSKTTNEMNYLAQKFARTVVGSNNIDSCNRT